MKKKDSERARRPPIYDRLAARYERAMRPLERRGLRALRAATLREMPEGARLLEIGAGTGLNFDFYPSVARAAAVEPSRNMARLAHMKQERPFAVELVQSWAEALPFGDDSFDAAFATLVFCSVSSPQAAFAELRRVVRPGGRVALLEHVRPAGPLGYVFDALTALTVAVIEDHFNRRTADEARRAGLEILRVEPHLFGIVQLIVCRVPER